LPAAIGRIARAYSRRNACNAKKQNSPSLGVRLLSDLRVAFGDRDALATDAILKLLHSVEESPWLDMNGKDLDARKMARLLNKYGVKPKVTRRGDDVFRGYETADLRDAWKRYLPSS
jgi:hypothetical protein